MPGAALLGRLAGREIFRNIGIVERGAKGGSGLVLPYLLQLFGVDHGFAGNVTHINNSVTHFRKRKTLPYEILHVIYQPPEPLEPAYAFRERTE
jgi:hypothetical protein